MYGRPNYSFDENKKILNASIRYILDYYSGYFKPK